MHVEDAGRRCNVIPLFPVILGIKPHLCSKIKSEKDEDRGGTINYEEAESCFSYTYQGLGLEGSQSLPCTFSVFSWFENYRFAVMLGITFDFAVVA